MARQSENSFELFMPSDSKPLAQYDWAKERGFHIWKFSSGRANYPQGLKDTPYDKIIWSYTVYIE